MGTFLFIDVLCWGFGLFIVFLILGKLINNQTKISQKDEKEIIALSIDSTFSLAQVVVMIMKWLGMYKKAQKKVKKAKNNTINIP